jgi:hypothetical protein
MLLDFIVCDDVRQEVGNKVTVVGVYSDEILIPAPPSWPVILPKLGVFLRIKPFEDFVPKNFEVRFLHDGKQIGLATGEVAGFDPDKSSTIVVVGSPFPLPGPGQLRFELSFTAGEQRREVPIDRSLGITVSP